MQRYGKCTTVVIGEHAGNKAAFLLQNIFPITEKYIDHIHTTKGKMIPVKPSLVKQISAYAQQLLALRKRGKTVVFPDINRLKQMMIDELMYDAPNKSINNSKAEPMAINFSDRLAAAKKEAAQRNAASKNLPPKSRDERN